MKQVVEYCVYPGLEENDQFHRQHRSPEAPGADGFSIIIFLAAPARHVLQAIESQVDKIDCADHLDPRIMDQGGRP